MIKIQLKIKNPFKISLKSFIYYKTKNKKVVFFYNKRGLFKNRKNNGLDSKMQAETFLISYFHFVNCPLNHMKQQEMIITCKLGFQVVKESQMGWFALFLAQTTGKNIPAVFIQQE